MYEQEEVKINSNKKREFFEYFILILILSSHS